MQALEVLDAALKDSVRKLSSFDKYKAEVCSGNLEWSPIHKDPVFWKENISKFEENDFQVLTDLWLLWFESDSSQFTDLYYHMLYTLEIRLVTLHCHVKLHTNMVIRSLTSLSLIQ